MRSEPELALPRIGTQLLAHSALYGLAGILAKAAALVTVPILSRTLSPGGYGAAELAVALAALAGVIASFAGDIPTARLAARTSGAEPRARIFSSYVAASVVVSGAIGLGVLAASDILATALWGDPSARTLVVLTALLIPLSSLQAALVTIQRISERPARFAALATVDLVAQLTLAVVLVLLGWGPAGILAGFVAGSALGLAVAALAARDEIGSLPDIRVARAIFGQGLAFLPAIVAFVAADYAVRVVLVSQVGAPGVGHFALATRIGSVMALVTSAFSLAWGPIGLSQIAGARTSQLFGRVFLGFSLAATTLALIIGIFAPEIVATIGGDAYRPAGIMLPGLVMSAAIAGGYYVLVIAAGISDKAPAVAWSSTIGAALQVVVTVALMPLGLWAVGVGALVGRLASLGGLAASLRRDVVSGLWTSTAFLSVAGAIAAAVQMLNAASLETAKSRLALAGVVLLGAMLIVFRRRLLRWP